MKTNQISIPKNDVFFSRDLSFYKSFLKLSFFIILQNIITYSVNMADNLMLGYYDQSALSGAAAINQIQFLLQGVIVMGLGQGIMIVGSQYWGKRQTGPIQKLTGMALKAGCVIGILLTAAAILSPESLARVFTNDEEILHQAVDYLSIIRYTYLFFIGTSILLAALRSVQVVDIALKLTIMTLFINVGINYCLIFGKFGLPEMGIQGAAIGTLAARIVEFCVLVLYLKKSSRVPFRFQLREMFEQDAQLLRAYVKVTIPCVISHGLFAGATAMQTVIFGHMNADAIAANAMASTMFQYSKMIPSGASSASNVMIGEMVGTKKWDRIRETVHSLQVIYLGIGVLASGMFITVSHVMIGFYNLTPEAVAYANDMFVVLSVIIAASSYQVPCLTGIISGGGDSAFVMVNDILYAGCFTIPVCLAGAFVFHLDVIPLLVLMHIDQVFKCVTNGIKTNRYTWIKTWAE